MSCWLCLENLCQTCACCLFQDAIHSSTGLYVWQAFDSIIVMCLPQNIWNDKKYSCIKACFQLLCLLGSWVQSTLVRLLVLQIVLYFLTTLLIFETVVAAWCHHWLSGKSQLNSKLTPLPVVECYNNNNDFFCANILEDQAQWRDKIKGLYILCAGSTNMSNNQIICEFHSFNSNSFSFWIDPSPGFGPECHVQ